LKEKLIVGEWPRRATATAMRIMQTKALQQNVDTKKERLAVAVSYTNTIKELCNERLQMYIISIADAAKLAPKLQQKKSNIDTKSQTETETQQTDTHARTHAFDNIRACENLHTKSDCENEQKV
jgi:hypothetical protein